MAKVYDVPSDVLVQHLARYLQESGIEKPQWTAFVKTGAHAKRPPQEVDWWYTRCASVLRKIYLNGPVGIRQLRREYGGGRPSGYGAAHHRDAGGAIIRNAVQGLESLGLVTMVEKRGRIITAQGMKKLDGLATGILHKMVEENPSLKIYQ